ncbi:MAG: SMC-Scp complex subunit ScpB [Acidobacteria bacterium]|nr:SMC-Scp complex subunit ScpB [Acidobacteriota bacterium]MYC83120.1 SMC-Scp complex subunit ScpB [Acidobacteriota bacterium]
MDRQDRTGSGRQTLLISECGMNEEKLRPIVEALVYLAEEPVTVASMIELLGEENEAAIRQTLSHLRQRYASPEHGIEIKEIADGYKMATKPEHHAWVRKFLKYQTPPIRLSLPALETLAVIAYRQPVTLPEIQEIRGVNAAAVMKTLVEKKLVSAGGRKNVVGRPILYKTTRDFLLQFGLKNLGELPSLDEYQELAQASLEGVAVVSGVESDTGAEGEVGRNEMGGGSSGDDK